ncbi:MAG: HDIG domain-containing protein [Sphingobacteriales bacterium]|nr:MAG: HDIG domain-containing protein [Sphingobacteriales bacterium]
MASNRPFSLKNISSLIVNKHLVIVRYLLVLICIGVISTLLPKENFNYDFELNMPWKYDNLYAPFTFTIKKLPDELLMEQQRMIDSLAPYYKIEAKVKEKVMEQFVSEFAELYADEDKSEASGISRKDSLMAVRTADRLLDSLYTKGIATLDEEHKKSGKPALSSINLLINNTLTILNTNQLFTNITDACQYVDNAVKAELPENLWDIIEPLCNSLQPNITFDRKTTREITEEELKKIAKTKGVVQQNELIIAQGALVKNEQYSKLQSLKNAYETQGSSVVSPMFFNQYAVNIGHFILVFVTILLFTVFLQIFEPATYYNSRKLTFILIFIAAFIYLIRLVVDIRQIGQTNFSLYMLPYCIVPIVMRNFFGNRTAMYVHIIIVLLSGFIVPMGFEFLFLHFIAGLAAILANERAYYWSDFFKSTAYIFTTYLAGFIGLSLIQEGSWATIPWVNLGWLVVNTFFCLLAYPLIPVFEKLFGFVSNITLAELSDLNKPLLRRLSRKAPGTFAHSLQVANLAEAASLEIGARPLLAKVGALYHDIGKMLRPIYFTENQTTEINPHDDIPYVESVRIIKEHVTHGVELAKKERLPNIITDFIRTHHGTTRVEYFYQNFRKENPNEEIDEPFFRYKGPLPYSKETAIVMMADSVEAASRSMHTPTDEQINNLVEHIIDTKIRDNQFVNCDLSFKDISVIKKVFKKQLRSIYHIRISYPDVLERQEV